MQYYSYFFSLNVVQSFLAANDRGWRILEKYTDMDIDDVVLIFQKSQKAWVAFKKVCKMAERLGNSPYFQERPKLLLSNLRSGYKYFLGNVDIYGPKGLDIPRSRI